MLRDEERTSKISQMIFFLSLTLNKRVFQKKVTFFKKIFYVKALHMTFLEL